MTSAAARLAVLVAAITLSCSRPGARSAETAIPEASSLHPARVVLFVADGAGVAHWSAAYLEADTLSVAGFPVVGLMDPANTSTRIPESASSATAIALGIRTFYHAVGVGSDSARRQSVLEVAEANGLATGLVTTTFLVDATPAAFAAHVPNRGQYAEIARQMAGAGIEVLLGDGRQYLAGGKGSSTTRLLDELGKRYAFVDTAEELRAISADTIEALLGLFDIDRVRDPSIREPSLAQMTATALEVLGRDPEGFFLLVENEHTDHGAHKGAPVDVIRAEILHLDRAIGVALAYRARHPETLLVVLGDHETGGLGLAADSTGALEARYVTGDHTAELVPVFAIGPGAERFAGIQSNAEIGRHLIEIVSEAR